MLTFDNENWSHREIRIDWGKETRSRIVGDTWNSGTSSFCTWLNTSTSIVFLRKYSSFCRPRSFLSQSRLRAYLVDVTSCQEKESTRIIKDSLQKDAATATTATAVGSPMHLSMRIVHSANTATTPRRAPVSRRSPSSRVVEEVMFLAYSARSSNLHLLPEFFAVSFIASTKSPEKRRPCLRRIKWKGSQKNCVTGRKMGQRGRKKNEEKRWKMKEERRKKLIAAFCSAINDDEGPKGGETFRWLGKDVLRCSLFFLLTPHPFFFPVSLLCLFPFSPLFSVKLSVTLNNNNNEGDDDGNDDRSANDIKGKNTWGTRKALKIPLYFVVGSIRSLARVKVINRRIPSRHFTPLFLFPLSPSPLLYLPKRRSRN